MSLTTWKQEFYPTEAKDCSADEALAHSLRKWRGLRPQALALHGLAIGKWARIEDGDGSCFQPSASNCALCALYFDEGDAGEDRPDDASPCDLCPLAISRGGKACDREVDGEETAPWGRWSLDKDPEPMIAALEKAAALASPQEEQRAL